MESALFTACRKRTSTTVKTVLENNPDIDVNWRNPEGLTALHAACLRRTPTAAIALLAHPNINVNQRALHGVTPLHFACECDLTKTVSLLMKDKRVDVNCMSDKGFTPLALAVGRGRSRVIMEMIASGRDLDLGERGTATDVMFAGRKFNKAHMDDYDLVVSFGLMYEFRKNPEVYRHSIRVRMQHPRSCAAELFGTIVMLSDGYLEPKRFKKPDRREKGQLRFLAIAKQLPMDLQMVLCHRVMQSARDVVTDKESDLALRSLLRECREEEETEEVAEAQQEEERKTEAYYAAKLQALDAELGSEEESEEGELSSDYESGGSESD